VFSVLNSTTQGATRIAAFAEGLIYLRDVEGGTGPAIIRPDSLYASDLALGLSVPHSNVALARRVRELWRSEYERRGGQLWSVWVKGHSRYKWNDRVDAMADRGAEGRVCGADQRWSAWPPLRPPQARAHRIDEAMRVSRATNVFGVLAHHVPIRGELLTDWQLRGLLARVERRLQGLSPTPCTRAALERARAAYRLLRVDVTQAAERQRLITEGLRPITTTLRCPVNVPVLQRYVERAGPEADVMPVGKAGQGTLRERAQRVVTAAGADGCITVSYRFSLLELWLTAHSSRELSNGVEVGARLASTGTLEPHRPEPWVRQ
jgi:ribonuclease HI